MVLHPHMPIIYMHTSNKIFLKPILPFPHLLIAWFYVWVHARVCKKSLGLEREFTGCKCLPCSLDNLNLLPQNLFEGHRSHSDTSVWNSWRPPSWRQGFKGVFCYTGSLNQLVWNVEKSKGKVPRRSSKPTLYYPFYSNAGPWVKHVFKDASLHEETESLKMLKHNGIRGRCYARVLSFKPNCPIFPWNTVFSLDKLNVMRVGCASELRVWLTSPKHIEPVP